MYKHHHQHHLQPAIRQKALSCVIVCACVWVHVYACMHVLALIWVSRSNALAGHQFKLFTNTFEREIAFQSLKRQYGSSYVFHGSKFLNWHSILRTSLQNFSNTQYMLNGAAYGSGVYVSPNVSHTFHKACVLCTFVVCCNSM